MTSLPGGYATLDGTVKQHLHRWVGPRRPTAPRSAVRGRPPQYTRGWFGSLTPFPPRGGAVWCRWFEEKGALKSARRLPSSQLSRGSISPGSGDGVRTLPHAAVVGDRPTLTTSAIAEAPSNDYLDVHGEADDGGFGFGEF